MESRSDSTPAWRDQPMVLHPGAPPAAPASAGPLTAEHMRQLASADVRARKLRSAGAVAMFNGITIGIFSALSLMWGLGELAFDGFHLGKLDWETFVVGAGLVAIAWNELRGRTLLRQFDPRATRVLGWNQLALLGLIVAYAAWMLAKSLLGPNPYDEIIRREPMAADMLGSVGNLYKTLSIAVYGALIIGTLIFQGLNSIYYFTRAKLLRGYIAETPAWVIDLQRCQAGGAVGSR
jgi:hypothetical protein